MLNRKFHIVIILCGFLACPVWASAEEETQACLNALRSPISKKEYVGQLGGIWGLFEKNSGLSGHSGLAVQLDSKINRLIWVSTHLCETLHGIPLNDFAIYLTQNLKDKGKDRFKSELLILGWPEKEINEGFRFADFSLKNQDRTLNLESVKNTLIKVEKMLKEYKNLALSLESNPQKELADTAKTLARNIDDLISNDTYLAQGLREITAVPRWDYEGSVGGS